MSNKASLSTSTPPVIMSSSTAKMPYSENSAPTNEVVRASIVISTFNRCDALKQTLETFAAQDLAPGDFEVIVTDDGSPDETWAMLQNLASSNALPYKLRAFRHVQNRGVSAGRNTAMYAARGEYIIMVSDDVLVPNDFIVRHLETLQRFPGFWVIGGFEQLPSSTSSPFGRFLNDFELMVDDGRKTTPLEPGIWELSVPTARNLSLPRVDLERTGYFDEQFRTTCEDQDLMHRADEFGIRYLLDEKIHCLHNDQTGDLKRHCNFWLRGMEDTVRLCAKYPHIHGGSVMSRVNGYVAANDGLVLMLKKGVKSVLATSPGTKLLESVTATLERAGAPETVLRRFYVMNIGVSMLRGWRNGLKWLKTKDVNPEIVTRLAKNPPANTPSAN